MVERARPAHPRIVIDAAQVDQVQQAGVVPGEHVVDVVDQFGAQPVGIRLGRVLLEEELLLDAVGVALERKRAVLQVGQDQVRPRAA